MKSRRMFAAAASVVAAGALAVPSAAWADDPTCDAYSGHCPNVEPRKIVRPPVVQGDRSILPFTGAEIVLMTAVAGGAIGAGTTMVVAGRRRRRAVV